MACQLTAPPIEDTGHERTPLIVRNGGFARVWAAQLLSQSATRMYQMGALWWLMGQVAAGDRGLASGLFLMSAALPPVVLAPVIARVIARHRSRSVLSGAALGGVVLTVTLAGFAAPAGMPTLAVCPVMFGLAACQALFDPCLTKAIPELVQDRDIEDATAFEQASFSLVGMASALLGAVLVELIGPTGVVGAGAIAYLGAAVCLRTVRFHPLGGEAQEEVSSGIGQAWRLLSGLPFIKLALVCFTAANFFITATFVVLPLYTKNVLHAPALTLGLLEGALWLGMLVGVFTGKRLPGHPGPVGGGCVALFGAATVVPGIVPDRTALLVCLAVAGWSVGAVNVVFVAAFQRAVPTAAKPVFFSAMLALLGAGFPVAAFVFGLAGDLLSPQSLFLVQSAGLLPIAAVLAFRSRRGTHLRTTV
ncbi:MFS transporter [Streptomyces alboniger]|uniref:MFS transporter n=1 Tax=Streptomyces alboniger TaxID=132473 RepID=A0A5J6HTP6_STRAD|nr:MFS transporter [Streptomyces alboniger]QEV21783.1 MFS transporter [Streptomyces alboniger]